MENEKPKLKVAIYWAAACGGCCVSVLDVHEKVLDVVKAADLVFWPIALDTKYADVEAMEDKFIDVCLFNGAIRNSENEHMAKLLRKKSKVLVAYGSCSHLGGVPGLGNLFTKDEILKKVYLDCVSNDNSDKIIPQPKTKMPEGEIELPEFLPCVKSLQQVVDVDYFIPGCPPQTDRFVEVFQLIASGAPLPPKGSVVGIYEKAVCEYCERKRTENKLVKEFRRPWEINDDGVTCFLEQGVICMGPATQGGCGARCIKANFPCTGCYGPSKDAPDPGAAMIAAIGTMIDATSDDEIRKVVEKIHDPVGTFYRYSVANSIFRRKIQ